MKKYKALDKALGVMVLMLGSSALLSEDVMALGNRGDRGREARKTMRDLDRAERRRENRERQRERLGRVDKSTSQVSGSQPASQSSGLDAWGQAKERHRQGLEELRDLANMDKAAQDYDRANNPLHGWGRPWEDSCLQETVDMGDRLQKNFPTKLSDIPRVIGQEAVELGKQIAVDAATKFTEPPMGPFEFTKPHQ